MAETLPDALLSAWMWGIAAYPCLDMWTHHQIVTEPTPEGGHVSRCLHCRRRVVTGPRFGGGE